MTISNLEAPLHEIISRILTPRPDSGVSDVWLGLGTMQRLNQQLERFPLLNFFNATLRGIGQVLFVNNPISGLLLLVAMAIQSPWLAIMAVWGTMAATLTAMLLKLHPGMIQNGIFGLNGMLVGAVLGFLGQFGNGAWNIAWFLAALVLSGLTTIVMQTAGLWFTQKFRVAPLGIPFISVALTFCGLIAYLPQPIFDLGPPPPAPASGAIEPLQLVFSLPVSLAQVYFADHWLAVCCALVAVAICTPVGLLVGLLGCAAYLLTGLLVGAPPLYLYGGLWGYNAVLTATAIGGIFYTPTLFSITLGVISAGVASIFSFGLVALFLPLKLPILSLPFAVTTIVTLLILKRSLPSLVPVALHAVASPEEHHHRFVFARDIISRFHKQLAAALAGQQHFFLFDQADAKTRGDLQYVFNAIDQDQSGLLSITELATHLELAGKPTTASEVNYLFKSMDSDGNGAIDFQEFGELMLRHRLLMSHYDEFVTYFLPIDANEDDQISLNEMNIAMLSVGEKLLTQGEADLLRDRMGGLPLTWNRFIEAILVT